MTTAFIDQNEIYAEESPQFTRDQLFSIILSKNLIDTLKIYCSSLHPQDTEATINNIDRFLLSKIIYQVSDTILIYYKKQNLYD